MGRRSIKLGVGSSIEAAFARHLLQSRKGRIPVRDDISVIKRFREYIGDTRLDRLSEELVKGFFQTVSNRNTRAGYASIIGQFLRFAATRLPVPVTDRGSVVAPVPLAPSKKEVALHQQWSVDKLIQKQQDSDELIAKLARKVIDHYLYFQGRMKGEPENLDDIYRFADECRELIQTNLPLFMSLSAQGRNLHPIIDERIQK